MEIFGYEKVNKIVNAIRKNYKDSIFETAKYRTGRELLEKEYPEIDAEQFMILHTNWIDFDMTCAERHIIGVPEATYIWMKLNNL